MKYSDIWKNARQIMYSGCSVCQKCNGVACKGKVPGIGSKGNGRGFTKCVEFLESVKINIDTIYDYTSVDAGCEFFGQKMKYPIFAAPIGGMAPSYDEAHYNPFAYVHSEKDILKLVNTIIANTKGDGEKSGEDFWVKAERLLYCALIGYIWYEAPEEEQNFSTLLEFINASEAREDDENFKNAVDELFEELEKDKPEHFAVRQYKKYKLAAGVVCSKRLLNQAVGKSLRTDRKSVV